MTYSHCESSLGSFGECRLSAGWPPTLRPNQLRVCVSWMRPSCYEQTSIRQWSFAFCGPTVWNGLPAVPRDNNLLPKTFGQRPKTSFRQWWIPSALLGRFCVPRSVYTNVTTCWPNGVQNRSFVVKRNKQHVGLTRQLYSNAKTLLLYALSQLVKPPTQLRAYTSAIQWHYYTVNHKNVAVHFWA